MRKTLPIILLLLTTNIHAQIGILGKDRVDTLVAWSKLDSLSWYEQAVYAEEALELAKKLDYSTGRFDAGMSAGISYLNLGDYEKTLGFFQDAHFTAIELDSTQYQAYSAYFLGNVHNYLEELDKAMEFFVSSLQLYENLGNLRWQGIVKNSMGVIYSKREEHEKALETYKRSLEIFESNEMIQESAIPISNIGNYYLELKQPAQALPYFLKSLELDEQFDSKKGKAITLGNLGLVYQQQETYDKAINYFEQSLEIAEKYHFSKVVYDNYKDLADTYDLMGQHQEALVFFRQYHNLRDSIFNEDKNEQIAELQVLFQTKVNEQRIAQQEEVIAQLEQTKRLNQLYIWIFGLSLVSLILIGYLWYSRQKVRANLVASELKNQELESEKLRKKLAVKEQDLTNFALDIARKNQFSNQVHDQLSKLVNAKPEEAREMARGLLMLTTQHLKINEDIREFQMNVEQVNQEFFNKLNQKFPDLSTNEKHLCGLIRLNLSTKDIAAIRNISPKSVEMGRYRLRKKLKLTPNMEINTFLQKL